MIYRSRSIQKEVPVKPRWPTLFPEKEVPLLDPVCDGVSKPRAVSVPARRLKKIWFCAIEEGFIDEAKIGIYLEQAKRKDCIKKILIALNGIDPNARLKALEAKVWIWDKNTVNELFSLFEKPRVVK